MAKATDFKTTEKWRRLKARKLAECPWCEDGLVAGKRIPATDVVHIDADPAKVFDFANLRSISNVPAANKAVEATAVSK